MRNNQFVSKADLETTGQLESLIDQLDPRYKIRDIKHKDYSCAYYDKYVHSALIGTDALASELVRIVGLYREGKADDDHRLQVVAYREGNDMNRHNCVLLAEQSVLSGRRLLLSGRWGPGSGPDYIHAPGARWYLDKEEYKPSSIGLDKPLAGALKDIFRAACDEELILPIDEDRRIELPGLSDEVRRQRNEERLRRHLGIICDEKIGLDDCYEVHLRYKGECLDPDEGIYSSSARFEVPERHLAFSIIKEEDPHSFFVTYIYDRVICDSYTPLENEVDKVRFPLDDCYNRALSRYEMLIPKQIVDGVAALSNRHDALLLDCMEWVLKVQGMSEGKMYSLC